MIRRRLDDIACVFLIHLARLRAEAGPFVLAAFVFPLGMYFFAGAVAGSSSPPAEASANHLRFLAGSIVFSMSLTAISWLGYLLLENRFTGRLKLFSTLPLAPSSYVLGILLFSLSHATLGTAALLLIARASGVAVPLHSAAGFGLLAVTIVLTMLCVSGVAVIIAARARSFTEGSLLTDALGAGLVLLAPVYYGPDVLPRALQLISRLLPTTYAARSVQATLSGRLGVGQDLLILSLMAAASLSAGFRLMKWRED
ncbi:MAG TPA: ABC transporter permease [Vicinamibacterales bacterium]|jgi:ABC-2 type transport system permease protein|nr:ABC transporter permease [Vicinamibacterales bacterium]